MLPALSANTVLLDELVRSSTLRRNESYPVTLVRV
jgi:hypothetical protein